MNDLLLSKIDDGIRRLDSLNALVERVVEHIAPKMSAAAASCGIKLWSQACQTGGYGTVACGQCGGGICYYRWEGVLTHYMFGYKAANFQKKIYCSPPSPNIATCNSNCS